MLWKTPGLPPAFKTSLCTMDLLGQMGFTWATQKEYSFVRRSFCLSLKRMGTTRPKPLPGYLSSENKGLLKTCAMTAQVFVSCLGITY